MHTAALNPMDTRVSASPPTLGTGACARHGLLGLAMSFVAVPLYVLLPEHHGRTLGVPLAWLGLGLMLARLADAGIDPWLGRWADRLLQSGRAPLALALSACALALGVVALFFPPLEGLGAMGLPVAGSPGEAAPASVALTAAPSAALLAWVFGAMAWTFLSYSLAQVLYLAWGTRLGGDLPTRARIVAWREGWGLLGVVMANVLALQMGLVVACTVLGLSLALGVALVWTGPRPAWGGALRHDPAGVQPWRQPAFRALMAVYLLNGVAAAVPATLVMFFVSDVLQARDQAPWCLGAYFVAAALSVPLWTRLIQRWGAWQAWAVGMAISVPPFLLVLALGPGDVGPYLAVCVVCGLALGADLTAPGTLLTGVVRQAGHADGGEGAYAGWWHWGAKLNLALAAGLALPALQWLGYQPGRADAAGLVVLAGVYGLLPCLFKLLALAVGWRQRHLMASAS
jgi:glycoside/pentoside/hexuronide:cation symporter, GPH family